MFSELRIRRLSAGSVYKLCAIGSMSVLVPFSLLMGLFAAFGAGTVSWNGRHLTGLGGLLASPFIGLFMAAMLTAFIGTLLVLGLWLYSRFRPLRLMVKDAAP